MRPVNGRFVMFFMSPQPGWHHAGYVTVIFRRGTPLFCRCWSVFATPTTLFQSGPSRQTRTVHYISCVITFPKAKVADRKSGTRS